MIFRGCNCESLVRGYYWGGPSLESKKLMCYGPENEIAAATFFAKTSTALTNRSAFASPTEWQDPSNTVADSISPAPPACCPSLPKHYVVWNCLAVVVAGFRSVAWVRC